MAQTRFVRPIPIPIPIPLPPLAAEPTLPIKLVYVGSFISRKGVDLLCAALAQLPSNSTWEFDWIGRGGEHAELVRHSAEANGNVRMLGPCRSDEVIARLSDYDLCVIPSRHDGWGMVGTEACLAGIGCIVSDAAGCCDLVRASGAGQLVKAGDVQALRDAIVAAIAQPTVTIEWKRRARQYRQLLLPKVAGEYLHDVIEHAFVSPQSPRPLAPWLAGGPP